MSEVLCYLTQEEKKAVMQVGYQMIEGAANAIGRRISERDSASVDIIIKALTASSGNEMIDYVTYTMMWNEAIWMNPYEAFEIVKHFDKEEKKAFKEMMLKVANKDLTNLRMDLARQIFERVNINELE